MNINKPYVLIGDNVIVLQRGHGMSDVRLVQLNAQLAHESRDLTADELEQKAKFIAERMSTYSERIPVDERDIYTTHIGPNVGNSHGPKGGAHKRLAKRRKANKSARKARRHAKA